MLVFSLLIASVPHAIHTPCAELLVGDRASALLSLAPSAPHAKVRGAKTPRATASGLLTVNPAQTPCAAMQHAFDAKMLVSELTHWREQPVPTCAHTQLTHTHESPRCVEPQRPEPKHPAGLPAGNPAKAGDIVSAGPRFSHALGLSACRFTNKGQLRPHTQPDGARLLSRPASESSVDALCRKVEFLL